MARDFVWAVDENGKPCKCYAKPENRGKGRCNHRFHAEPGEDQKEFFSKLGLDSQTLVDAFSVKENSASEEAPEIHIEDLPNYDDMIKNVVHITDTSYEDISSGIEEDVINNSYYHRTMFKGAEVTATQETDPDNPEQLVVHVKFVDEDGSEFNQDIHFPKPNERGEYMINGKPYRFIPTLEKNKADISKNAKSGNIYLRGMDRSSDTVIYPDKGVFCVKTYDENGRYTYNKDLPIEELDKFFAGKDTNLSDPVKESLKKLHPGVYEKYSNGGINAILSVEPEALNDLDNRRVSTYKDRVLYSVSRKFASMDSVRRKKKLHGDTYDYNVGNIDDMIKKDLVNSSYMQLADNYNPIAAMSQSQRMAWVGEGSWTGDNIVPSLRSVHPSYYGLVDPSDVSLGGKVGLSVAVKGHINKSGVIEKDEGVLTGSSFIPYMHHSDPTRAAMAISQMKEACPIIGGEDPKVSTPGWDKIKGSKLGVNMNVAYVAEGGVWEDAVVISESAAKKMTTVQTKTYNIRNMPKNLKIGTEIDRYGKIGSTEIRYGGVVKSIDGDNVTIESVYPMGVGDKLSGRHGNKGVVSEVRPDDQMPKVDGKTADLIMSPFGVAGRSNLSQVLEVNDGDQSKKRRIDYKGHIMEGTGGTQFIMRINQIAEKKLITNADKRGEDKEYKSRQGEMESILLSTSPARLRILEHLRNQEANDTENKLDATLKSAGIQFIGVNAANEENSPEMYPSPVIPNRG